ERAKEQLIIAEQTATSLKIEVNRHARALAKQPPKTRDWLGAGTLYLGEGITLTLLFNKDLGYPLMTAFALAFLYTTGTFALTRTLYVNLQKPPHERAWYTIPLALVFA